MDKAFFKEKNSKSIYYLIVRIQASFRHPYTHITHSKKEESKKYKDDKKGTALKKIYKKDTGPHEIDEKPKRGNKADKTPSKSSHGSQLSKKSKSKSETNPESKDSISVSIKHQKKKKRDIQKIPRRWILNPQVRRSTLRAQRIILMPYQRLAQKIVQMWV